ncbi:MAG: Uma2 family endonuclease [Cytophagales bacterium]|nr:Uma2 family endonuclease [Cytophagales bacterium]
MHQKLVIDTLKPGGLTDEEFFAFCVANKELRIERNSKREILIMPPSGSETGFFNAGLIIEIGVWNRQTGLGIVFDSSAGFTLPNKAVRAADVAWMGKERWEAVPEADRKKFARICPDFVAEIKSPSDSVRALQEKMREWLENGCRLGWLIDPEDRQVYVYTPGQPDPPALPLGKVNGAGVLPGLEIDLNEIFEH